MVKIKDMLAFDAGVNEHWFVEYKGDTTIIDPTQLASFEADEDYCQTVLTFKDGSVTKLDGLVIYNDWKAEWKKFYSSTRKTQM